MKIKKKPAIPLDLCIQNLEEELDDYSDVFNYANFRFRLNLFETWAGA